jgi:hypothetical protein
VRTVFGVSGVSALDAAAWVSAALTVVHLVAAAALMTEQRPPAAAGRTRWSHALSEARTTPAVIAQRGAPAGHNRVLLALVGVEVFWSVGMITFESLMPLRLEELVGSAERAGALVGPVSAAGWGLFAVGSWLAGVHVGTHRRRPSGHGRARAQCARGRGHGPGRRPGRARRGLPVHLLHARDERPAPRGAAAPAGEASANRATVLSINSMMAFLAFAVAAPLVGTLADRASISTAMVTAGAISALGVACYLPARRQERTRTSLETGAVAR